MPDATRDFWAPIRAHRARQEAAEAAPDPADVPLEAWAGFRDSVGLPETGEFVGVQPWRRPERYVHHEQSEIETWAAGERQAAGIHEAPDAGCGDTRVNPSAWRII
jgi:hypothetical protein